MYFFLLITPHPPKLVSSLRLSSDQTKSSPSKKKNPLSKRIKVLKVGLPELSPPPLPQG
jgi:hypothetical protein